MDAAITHDHQQAQAEDAIYAHEQRLAVQYLQRSDTISSSNSCSNDEHESAVPPGFRFHPTEEELVGYYLRRMLQGHKLPVQLIPTVDLYSHDPWELPDMAARTKVEPAQYWYFFVPRSSKFRNGERPTRLTKSGYWKATGTDTHVHAGSIQMSSRVRHHHHEHDHDHHCHGNHPNHHRHQFSALRKTLVFYKGRAPRGTKTFWVMNEYRMDPSSHQNLQYDIHPQNIESTICRLRQKRLMWPPASKPAISIFEGAGGRSIPERDNALMEVLYHEVSPPAVSLRHHSVSTSHDNSTLSGPSKHDVLACNTHNWHVPTLSSHEERLTSQDIFTLSHSTRSKGNIMRPTGLQLRQLSKSAPCPDMRFPEAAVWTPSPGLGRPKGDSSSIISPSLDDLLLNMQSYVSNPHTH